VYGVNNKLVIIQIKKNNHTKVRIANKIMIE